MSIFGALNAAVSGLDAQSSRLSTISDNIANSATTGYKRSEVEFSTLITDQVSQSLYAPGGVRGNVRSLIDRQGLLQSTSSATDLGINGNGFFVVSDVAGADPTQDLMALTRAGSFAPDDHGYLRNAAGYYLMGWGLKPDGTPINPALARNSFTGLEAVNVDGIYATSAPTTAVDFAANLPAQLANGTPGTPIRTNVEYFGALGQSYNLTLEWTPSPDSVANHWGLKVYDSQTGGGTTAVYDQIVQFHDTGANAGLPAVIPGQAAGKVPLSVNGGTQTIQLDIGTVDGAGGVTQFAGDYTPSRISKDGTKIGAVSGVQIGADGVVDALFNNGLRRPIFQIPLAVVPDEEGLEALQGGAYRLSQASGDVYLWDAQSGPAGQIDSSALERSTVDLAQELTGLIETQRSYSSNAKVVQTADEMLEVVNQLKR